MAGNDDELTISFRFDQDGFCKFDSRRIERVCGLVEQDDIGRFHDGAGNAQALLHSKRVFTVRAFIFRVKSDFDE